MKKSLTLSLVAAFVLVGAYFAPRAEAVPPFARQTGTACFGCHYQYIPQLNAFGRSFKLGGFTQTAQDTIKDEGLDLNPNLNLGVMMGTQLTYGTTSGASGNNNGQWNIDGDASLFAGGRVGADMGALAEMSSATGASGTMFSSTKFVYSHDFGGVNGGVVLYRTASGGPAYSMDLWNTGSTQNTFGWFSGATFFQGLGAGIGNSQGLNIFAGNSLFFANFGLFAPVDGTTAYNPGLNLADYYRVAFTPSVGGADLMIGVQGTAGRVTRNQGGATSGPDAELRIDMSSWTVDAQAQMDIGGMPTQVTAAYGAVPNLGTSNNSCIPTLSYNCAGNDITGFDVTASMSISKMFGVKAAYGLINNVAGSTVNDNGIGLGVWANVAQNVRLTVEQWWYNYTPSNTATAANGPDTSTTTIDFKYYF